jgi:hypothetical protein
VFEVEIYSASFETNMSGISSGRGMGDQEEEEEEEEREENKK